MSSPIEIVIITPKPDKRYWIYDDDYKKSDERYQIRDIKEY